jgi:hypothetical protein
MHSRLSLLDKTDESKKQTKNLAFFFVLSEFWAFSSLNAFVLGIGPASWELSWPSRM